MKNEENIVWELLENVKDPEIPVLSVVDMGIVRNVTISENLVNVTITPTYSGCPAMQTIEDDIKSYLNENGINVTINTVLFPPWTTDWLTESGKNKLEEYGITPPQKTSLDKNALFVNSKNISCPRCKSYNTELISQFGSTPCKALYKCKDCLEPFDYFKCI
jgi:ring-1,2-phenylacetyl-CoA epoxidase subunit PaaD